MNVTVHASTPRPSSVAPARFIVDESSHRLSLVRFLARMLPEITKSRIRDLLGRQSVLVNSAAACGALRLSRGDVVELRAGELPASGRTAEEIPLNIIFEDASLLVIDKPAGMLVHATRGEASGTLLNGVMHHCLAEAPSGERPGIVNRLDRHTSGLVIAAKTAQAHRVLSKHFRKGWVEKRYVALVHGAPAGREGFIEAPIGRRADQWPRWQVCGGGRTSATGYSVIGRLRRERSGRVRFFSLLDLRPRTGRTHQLRIHTAWLGHAIAGDYVYGRESNEEVFGPPAGLATQEPHCLHACSITLRHPLNGEIQTFEAAPAPIIASWVKRFDLTFLEDAAQ